MDVLSEEDLEFVYNLDCPLQQIIAFILQDTNVCTSFLTTSFSGFTNSEFDVCLNNKR